MRKSVGAAVLLVGLAVLAVGFMLGFTGVTSDGYDCGSAFGQARNPEDVISFNAPESTGCTDARSSRSTTAYAGLILGGAVSLGGLIVIGRRGD